MPQYRLFSWGANSHGQLGHGDIKEEELLVPREVNLSSINLEPENIVRITGGAGHTMLLDNAGRLFSCGWNDKGQAGVSGASSRFQRMEILEGEKIIDIACGWDSTMALSASGQLFTWGSNSHGQLGLKRIVDVGEKVDKPLRVELDVPVKRITMGLRHSAVITRDGRVFVCGAATKGQLGVGLGGAKFSAEFVEVPQIKNAKDVACGQHHTIVVTNDNEIFAWGDNKHGQLGIDFAIQKASSTPIEIKHNQEMTNINRIYCGWTHSAVLTADNKVFCWGRNSYGQLGRGRSVQAVGTWQAGSPTIISPNIQQLAVGSEHNVALFDYGSIVSWGWNEHGNCGNGSIEDIFVPTKIMPPESKGVLIGAGAGHSFAVVETSS